MIWDCHCVCTNAGGGTKFMQLVVSKDVARHDKRLCTHKMNEGMTLHPGEEWTRKFHCNGHLTLAALECRPEKNNGEQNPASCLLLKMDNNDHVICTLEKGSTPQQNLDLVLQQRETVTFTVEGNGIVYLTGYSSGDNTFEATAMSVETITPLVEGEVGCESLTDHAMSSDAIHQSEQADNLDVVPAIKQEVDESCFSEVEESQTDGACDAENQSMSYERLDNPPECMRRDLQRETQAGRDDISDFEKQGLSVDRGIVTQPSTCKIWSSGDMTERESTERDPEESIEGHISDVEDRLPVVMATDQEASSVEGLKRRTYETSDDHISRVTVLPRRNQNKHRRRKALSVEGQTIANSFPATIPDPALPKNLKSRSVIRQKEKTFGQQSEDNNYDRSSLSESFLFHHERIFEGGQLEFRPFRCQYCGKPFLRKAYVRVHERIHTGEKPFKCRHCDKTFSQKAHVRSHEIVHTGDKNFRCQYCNKAFAHLSTARRHERIHMREQLS